MLLFFAKQRNLADFFVAECYRLMLTLDNNPYIDAVP
jgi:hypothetical protein